MENTSNLNGQSLQLMDLGPLTRLKDSLEIATNNTTNMLWKLQEFDTRLIALDKKMAPIQNVPNHLLCLSFD
jgi:hypothetical protein